MVAVLSLPSMIYTGSYIISDAPAPETGVELPPEGNERLSEGLLFIVLDGGVKHLMDDKELQQAKREVFGLFAVCVTAGLFASMIGTFIWMFWVGV